MSTPKRAAIYGPEPWLTHCAGASARARSAAISAARPAVVRTRRAYDRRELPGLRSRTPIASAGRRKSPIPQATSRTSGDSPADRQPSATIAGWISSASASE